MSGSVRLSERSYPLAEPTSHVMLSHVAVFVREQLLRVRQVPRVGCCLRPQISKLEAHAREFTGFVESRAQSEVRERLAVFVVNQVRADRPLRTRVDAMHD